MSSTIYVIKFVRREATAKPHGGADTRALPTHMRRAILRLYDTIQILAGLAIYRLLPLIHRGASCHDRFML